MLNEKEFDGMHMPSLLSAYYEISGKTLTSELLRKLAARDLNCGHYGRVCVEVNISFHETHQRILGLLDQLKQTFRKELINLTFKIIDPKGSFNILIFMTPIPNSDDYQREF